MFGVRCPSLGCTELIEAHIFQSIVDQQTYERFAFASHGPRFPRT
jgi:hypothetical protein